MTVFAGVLELTGRSVSAEHVKAVKNIFECSISAPITTEFVDDAAYLISYDIGAFEKQSIVSNKDKVTFIAGDPLMGGGVESDIASCHRAGEASLRQKLMLANGVFSGLSYDAGEKCFCLFTDKLGIRPVFYHRRGNTLYFSSLLKVLAALPSIELEIDFDGIFEHLSLGYSLSNNSFYKDVKRLRGGEILVLADEDIKIDKYFDLSEIQTSGQLGSNTPEELDRIFDAAIERRSKGSTETFCFLSGGLDSRVIASKLIKRFENVNSFNFSTNSSQDKEFARLFATKAGLNHSEVTLPLADFPNWSKLVSNELLKFFKGRSASQNNKLVWSGDGGSVGMGWVYIDESICSLLLNDDPNEAIMKFLQNNKIALPERFLKPAFRGEQYKKLVASISNELVIEYKDKPKSIFNFLMNNDQSRHLQNHFETICDHQTELLLPFFDSQLIEKIYSIPSHELLYHKLYMNWFGLFPEEAKSCPWQTYPGHVPCPIEYDTKYYYQWDKKGLNREVRKSDYLDYLGFRETATFKLFYNKSYVRVAMLLHRFGFRDYSYLVRNFKTLVSMNLSCKE